MSREDGLYSNYADEVRDWVKMQMVELKALYEAEVLKNEELQEKITCLESDSMNEVSQAEFDDMVEEKDAEIKRLIQKCNTSILKRKEIEKKIPELLEEERYREREANERDWNDKSEEQIEELQEKIKCLERLNMKAPTQGFRLVIEEENKKLKEENKKLKESAQQRM